VYKYVAIHFKEAYLLTSISIEGMMDTLSQELYTCCFYRGWIS